MYLYNGAAALCHVPDGSLLGVPFLFINNTYRKKVLGHVKNPLLHYFWDTFYESNPDKARLQQTMSSLNKLFVLLTDPTIRNIIGQVRTSFAVRDTGLIVATFPPQLGREKASFLASLLLSYLPDIPTILDGGHHLSPMAIRDKSRITFSHEYLDQVSESMQEWLIGTAESLVAFRLGPKDARRLEMEFELNRNQSTLLELCDNQFHRKTTRLEADLFVPSPDWPIYPTNKVRNISRSQNAGVEGHVERKINTFLTAIGR
jgi:hypothetical protein